MTDTLVPTDSLNGQSSASSGPRPFRIAALAGLSTFVLINLIIAPFGPYFARQHSINMMQPGRTDAGATVTPRFDWSTGQETAHYWEFIPDARKARLVVLDGMSQQYAINDERVGDLTTSEILDDSLGTEGNRVFGVAAPNLTNEELLLHLVTLSARPETTPSLLVIGVCFDKMRNVDIRPAMQQQLLNRPEITAEWKRIADSISRSLPVLAKKMTGALEAHVEREQRSLAQRVEEVLVRRAGQMLPVIRMRSDLRAYLLGSLFELRNWVFAIKTSSKRPMLADRFSLNQDAYVATLRLARQHGIPVLAYVIPLNPLATSPYVELEYVAFKLWLDSTTTREGATFANLESTIPREDWGLLNGEPDFKHFREAGHVATANRLLLLIRLGLSSAERR
jgi:hypothetical protein